MASNRSTGSILLDSMDKVDWNELTESDKEVLQYIHNNGKSKRPEISEGVERSAGTVYQSVDKLMDMGVVGKDYDPLDPQTPYFYILVK